MDENKGMLHIVATPIGNSKDMSPRGTRILNEVDIIAAEDTRRSMVLLNMLGVKNKLVSNHKFNEHGKASYFINEMLSGKSVAVKTGTKSKDYADSLAETYNFTVVTFESSPDIYQAVISGQCAACFDDTPIMADYIKSNGVPIQLVAGTESEGADYGMAIFNPEKQEIVDKFNAGLANIKANGKYDEILAKYLGE